MFTKRQVSDIITILSGIAAAENVTVDLNSVVENLRGETSICTVACSADGSTGEEMCTFTAKVNLHASELGYFQFEECGDIDNPTIGLEVGKTYHFIQNDPSNQ